MGLTPPAGVAYRTRVEWVAAAPRGGLKRFPSAPARTLFVHHTVTALTGDPDADFRKVQDVAFGRGFVDVSYPELIGPDYSHAPVYVAEGRGVQWVGAHTVSGTGQDLNYTALAIAFVGNYHPPAETPLPIATTARQRAAFRWRVAELKAEGWLARDAIIRPHRSVKDTACPGDNVVDAAVWADLIRPYNVDEEEDMFTDDDRKLLEEVRLAVFDRRYSGAPASLYDLVHGIYGQINPRGEREVALRDLVEGTAAAVAILKPSGAIDVDRLAVELVDALRDRFNIELGADAATEALRRVARAFADLLEPASPQ